ncbi:MAG: ctaG [Gemmatimonadetes bacterium]|jgi:putative membrane protein|nr:ctaG [Gemmatimonadota bacterium]
MPLPVALLLHPAARLSFSEFTVHWSTVIGLALLGALYHWRAGAVPPPDARERPPTTGQRASFFTALALIFLSLNGWVHDLSDYYLFSAHMVQHLVLTLVAPPLMIMGTPGWMLRPALRWRGVGPLARWITAAPQAFLLFNVVIVAWHLPPMYEMALEHHNVHIVQHLCFMVTSVLMWWPVLSPMPELPRLAYPGQMLYLFLMTIPMSIVAVSIAYADHILYPAYASAPRVWGISPLQDQMIGALVMWIPGSFFFFTIISVVFFKWQQRDEDSSESAQVGYVRQAR